MKKILSEMNGLLGSFGALETGVLMGACMGVMACLLSIVTFGTRSAAFLLVRKFLGFPTAVVLVLVGAFVCQGIINLTASWPATRVARSFWAGVQASLSAQRHWLSEMCSSSSS